MKTIVHASAGLLGVGLLVGCEQRSIDADDIPIGAETGRLLVDLEPTTDSGMLDPRVEEIWIRVESVEALHDTNGWVEVSEGRQDVDLMTVIDGEPPTRIGSADVWVGGYSGVRLSIVDAWIVADGTEETLEITGLDPMNDVLTSMGPFYVDENTVTTVRIGWDLDLNLENRNGTWFLGTGTTLDVDLAEPGPGQN
jgi:hypothetical protein